MARKPQYTNKQVVDIYRKSSGVREAATRLKISHSRVHQIVTLAAPELLRTPGRQMSRYSNAMIKDWKRR